MCCYYRHGRTETIRPATAAAKTCAEMMQSSHSAGLNDMMNAVTEATNKHFELTRNAAMGRTVPVYVVMVMRDALLVQVKGLIVICLHCAWLRREGRS